MSEDQVLNEWQKVIDAKQTVTKYRSALAGDGGGTVNVSGEPGYIWCRYSADQSKVSKVFNIIAPGLPEDFPIVVGRRFPTDEFEQVLAVNWTLYQDVISQDTVDNFTTGNHGESHNAASGADPSPIDLRNIVEMRGRAQETADLTIKVERGQYVFGSDVKRYPGADVDLTASVPAVVGHRFVLVYVDGTTNAAAFTDGAIVPLAAAAPIPDLTVSTIPVCLVDLENGQTTITEDDIYDWRFLWQMVSFSAPTYIGTNAARTGLTIANLAELTRFYTTDTDKIWEVWDGAWRLIYPPSSLSTSDGDAVTPWNTDGFGILTGSQNLQLYEGVSDSPLLIFIGGSNDDEISFGLRDSANPGESDLLFTLAGDSNAARWVVENASGDTAFEFAANGQEEQTVSDAATNTVTTATQIDHQTTGVAAAGFGERILFRLEDAGGTMEDAAAISVEWEDAGAAAEATLIRFWLRKAGVALGPFIEFGATENVFNESGADIDFRVEGVGDANALFVQGSDGMVGIGTNTPAAVLDVAGDYRMAGTVTNNYAFRMSNLVETNVNRGLFQVQGTIDPTAAGLTLRGQLFLVTTTSSALDVSTIIASDYRCDTAASYTGDITNIYELQATNPVHAGSGTITTLVGINISNLTSATNNRAIQCAVSSGANKHNLYINGTADNYLEGNLGIGAPSPGSITEWDMATLDLEFVDAGTAAATEAGWIEVQVGGSTQYIRTFNAK